MNDLLHKPVSPESQLRALAKPHGAPLFAYDDADPELDELVAERVMGWQRFPYFMRFGAEPAAQPLCPPGRLHVSTIAIPPAYSTETAASWQVVDALVAAGFSVWIEWGWVDGEKAADVNVIRWTNGVQQNGWAQSASLPLAVCRAALAAVKRREVTP